MKNNQKKKKKKKKTYKLGIHIRNFCPLRDITKEMKWQSLDWEKAFANIIPDKRPVSWMYKNHS